MFTGDCANTPTPQHLFSVFVRLGLQTHGIDRISEAEGGMIEPQQVPVEQKIPLEVIALRMLPVFAIEAIYTPTFQAPSTLRGRRLLAEKNQSFKDGMETGMGVVCSSFDLVCRCFLHVVFLRCCSVCAWSSCWFARYLTLLYGSHTHATRRDPRTCVTNPCPILSENVRDQKQQNHSLSKSPPLCLPSSHLLRGCLPVRVQVVLSAF